MAVFRKDSAIGISGVSVGAIRNLCSSLADLLRVGRGWGGLEDSSKHPRNYPKPLHAPWTYIPVEPDISFPNALSAKLSPLLKLKYHNTLVDAVTDLGPVEQIREVFAEFQKYLYETAG